MKHSLMSYILAKIRYFRKNPEKRNLLNGGKIKDLPSETKLASMPKWFPKGRIVSIDEYQELKDLHDGRKISQGETEAE